MPLPLNGASEDFPDVGTPRFLQIPSGLVTATGEARLRLKDFGSGFTMFKGMV